jgi:hypothetical protein
MFHPVIVEFFTHLPLGRHLTFEGSLQINYIESPNIQVDEIIFSQSFIFC